MHQQLFDLIQSFHLPAYGWNLMVAGLSLFTALLLKLIISLSLKKKTHQATGFSFFRSAIHHLGKPLNYFIPLFIFNLLLPLMSMHPAILIRLDKAVEIALILNFSWLLINSIKVIQEYVYYKYDFKKENNLRERKIRTQLLYLKQVSVGLIVFLTIGAVLLSFSSLRRIGAGLLTSVGIGGVIVGFAAQKSLGNLLAGFQLAFTQPIRIDDVVVVEGEWGRVDEITLTYVVVHIWDERRLVVPINYFIEKPFQNWTRTTSDLIGSVFIYADYTLPVEPLRQELSRLLKASALWDGKINVLQVTDANEKSVQLRALMSARNSSEAFDLRCYAREQLIHFIQKNYKDSLPKIRAELSEGVATPANNV